MEPKWVKYEDVSNLKIRTKENFIKLREANDLEKDIIDAFINGELIKTQSLAVILLVFFGGCSIFMLFPLIKTIVYGTEIKNLWLYICFLLLFIFMNIKMFKTLRKTNNPNRHPEINYQVMDCNISSSIIVPGDEGLDTVYIKLCKDDYYCTDIFQMDIMLFKKIKKHKTQVLLTKIEDKYYIIPNF